MKVIASVLDVHQRPDSEFLAIRNKQHSGTCDWLTTDRSFQDWTGSGEGWELMDSQSHLDTGGLDQRKRILWLAGWPGTGKSVAAAHVVNYL